MSNPDFQKFWQALNPASRDLLLQLAGKLEKLTPLSPTHNAIDAWSAAIERASTQHATPALTAQECQSLVFCLQIAIASGDIPFAGKEDTTIFNLQNPQLQSAMQDENRNYTMVSNIMKTKHDTVKNTISNIH